MKVQDEHLNSGFLSNLIRQISGLIVVMDSNSKFIYSNNYTAGLFGYPTEESMLGLNAFDMRCPAVECAEDFLMQDRIVRETGKELAILDIHGYANGETKILLTKKSPFRENGQITGSICHCIEMNSITLNQICSVLINTDKKYYDKNKKERSYTLDLVSQDKELSEREKECVFFLLRGLSMKQIAYHLGLSPRTVEFYIEKIKIKLNCNSKSKIIEYGLSKGYLNYIPSFIINKNISTILYKDNVPLKD